MESRRRVRAPAMARSARKAAVGPERPTRGHQVQFYDTEEHLYDTVSRFVADGLRQGEPALVCARAERFPPLWATLETYGVDVSSAEDAGQILFVDAASLLEGLVHGGVVDGERFRTRMGEQLARLSTGGASVRVYGELVDVLWEEGRPAAALRLEELWNELAQQYSFTLLCGYALSHFAHASASAPFGAVCDLHTHVLPAKPRCDPGDEAAVARELSELQQRARALETEIAERKRLEQSLREALLERRRVEEEIRAAKEEAERANAAKTEFLAVVSHELRTPLNAIIGYHDLLQHEIRGPLSKAQRAYVGRIGHGAHQLLRLINQVLSLTRIDAGRDELHVERVDLGALVQEATADVAPLVQDRQLTLAVHEPPRPLVVELDAGKLRHILLNLLSNAVKFTASGGISVNARLEEDVACVDVQDTGVGVLRVDQERIFEPFVQVDGSASRRYEGTGLGLSISRELARLMGGDVTVRSAPGSGSVFTVRVPARVASDTLPAQDSTTGGAASASAR